MKRLFIDIETSPIVTMVWGAGYDKFVHYKNILKERSIICIAWKWQGGEAEVATWDIRQSDKALIKRVVPLLTEADEVIAHNGDRFDLPWIRTRALYHNLPPLPVVRMVDTLKWARRFYYFNSNKLDYLAQFLGIPGKPAQFTEGEGSWRKVMQGDRKELAAMAQYCVNDVEGLLEPVWERLSLACPVATHVGVANGASRASCPRCGSERSKSKGRAYSAKGVISYRRICQECGGNFSISGKIKKAA